MFFNVAIYFHRTFELKFHSNSGLIYFTNINKEKPDFSDMAQAPKADFVPDRCYWIIIKNKNYEVLRNDPNWSGFEDIPNVDADATNAKAGFISLGASIADITTVENASFEDLKSLFGGVQRNVIQNW